MPKIKDMKIVKKMVVPMIVLLIAVIMNGAGAVINLNYVMDSSDEVNNVYFANVYNLEMLNGNFESLQKLVYAHCVATDNQHLRDIET